MDKVTVKKQDFMCGIHIEKAMLTPYLVTPDSVHGFE